MTVLPSRNKTGIAASTKPAITILAQGHGSLPAGQGQAAHRPDRPIGKEGTEERGEVSPPVGRIRRQAENDDPDDEANDPTNDEPQECLHE